MISPGTNSSLYGKRPKVGTSTEESIYLYLILQAINNMSGNLNRVLGNLITSFVVGVTPDAPNNGDTSWTPTTIDITGVNSSYITFILNGITLNQGTDYIYDTIAGSITLILPPSFTTNDIITIQY